MSHSFIHCNKIKMLEYQQMKENMFQYKKRGCVCKRGEEYIQKKTARKG